MEESAEEGEEIGDGWMRSNDVKVSSSSFLID